MQFVGKWNGIGKIYTEVTQALIYIYMSVRARRLERGHLGRRCLRGGVSKRNEAREGEAREVEWLEQEQSGEA